MPDCSVTVTPSRTAKPCRKAGFTLIEMSIVLVVIGLIVGGILVGQDLIRAAGVRSQISQIEKLNSATNTFYEKFGFLPGDIPPTPAAQYGLPVRTGAFGYGNGDGLIEGVLGNIFFCYEGMLFFQDLGTVGLVEGTFSGVCGTSTNIGSFLPPAKIGLNNYVTAYGFDSASLNYFSISEVTTIEGGWNNIATANIPVNMAYMMDSKVDDGLPQSGRVIAAYVNHNLGTGNVVWAGGPNEGAHGLSGGAYPNNFHLPTTLATVGSITTCYDNSTSTDGQTAANGNAQHYSLEMSNGSGANCALSFKFQAGD